MEGKVYIPEAEGIFPAIVVCHHHPFYGGNMEKNLIKSLCNTLVTKSFIVLKFNFQGVGGSQGTFNIGNERLADINAAVSFITSLNKIDPARVGLVGYSAGAAWGLAAAHLDARIKALVAISPPLSLFDFKFLCEYRKPKLLISGSSDEHIQGTAFIDFCKKLSEPVEFEVIEDADHSWEGYEDVLAERVGLFFGRVLG